MDKLNESNQNFKQVLIGTKIFKNQFFKECREIFYSNVAEDTAKREMVMIIQDALKKEEVAANDYVFSYIANFVANNKKFKKDEPQTLAFEDYLDELSKLRVQVLQEKNPTKYVYHAYDGKIYKKANIQKEKKLTHKTLIKDQSVFFPWDMKDEVVEYMVSYYKEDKTSFVMIVKGNVLSGIPSDDTCNTKGILGLEKGFLDMYFPILIGAKIPDSKTDDDSEIEKLFNEGTVLSILQYLTSNDLSLGQVLGVSGSKVEGNVLAIQEGLAKTKIVYKVDNFKANAKWSNVSLVTNTKSIETVKKDLITKREISREVEDINSFEVHLNGKLESKHDSLKEAEVYINAKREVQFLEPIDVNKLIKGEKQ